MNSFCNDLLIYKKNLYMVREGEGKMEIEFTSRRFTKYFRTKGPSVRKTSEEDSLTGMGLGVETARHQERVPVF